MSTKKILILGGSGYIGSHTNLFLLEKGCETVVYDREKPEFLDFIYQEHKSSFVLGDLLETEKLEDVFKQHEILAVIHFAASIEVAESQINPQKYYQNNVVATLNLLKILQKYQVSKIVFSSTAAVYGLPKNIPIQETEPIAPINTYGQTKAIVEQILHDYHCSYGLNSITLRYFNACGADFKTRTGETHEPETHLIPIILQTLLGKRDFIQINGQDYATPDGTCIRDYIHVWDLAAAHFLAVKKLLDAQASVCEAVNLGTKKGYSIMQILDSVEKVTGQKIPTKVAGRRAGDPDILVADNTKAKNYLGWEPEFSNLEDIVSSAWKWHKK